LSRICWERSLCEKGKKPLSSHRRGSAVVTVVLPTGISRGEKQDKETVILREESYEDVRMLFTNFFINSAAAASIGNYTLHLVNLFFYACSFLPCSAIP
jgi:hypothetical protein